MKLMSRREYEKTKQLAWDSLLISLMVFTTSFEFDSKFMTVLGIIISSVWAYDARRYFAELREEKKKNE